MTAYYNEIDPKAAATLRELIRAGAIAPGEVDERSIADVAPSDLVGYRQCHFFAGAGVWSYALRLAGWGDDEPVWTGSCPCQPFSVAGRQRGAADERHLWPEFRRLIAERNPAIVFGEQVASPAGRTWLRAVRADLEGMGYAAGGADLCAAGVGAPHMRQRLYWVADAAHSDGRRRERREETGTRQDGERWRGPSSGGVIGGLADGIGSRLEGHGRDGDDGHEPGRLGTDAAGSTAQGGAAHGMGDTARGGCGIGGDAMEPREGGHADGSDEPRGSSATDGHWRAADWLFCRDGRWRPVEPGTSPLAHGAPARVGRLRLYGNAIVAQVAQEFIGAYLALGR